MLRYQVNPHFFFNSLNSIRALIDESPERAREMVTQLSELFRYSLLDETETSLGDELGAIRNYLAIQKIRFEDKLEVVYEIETSAEAVRLPSFLIHPLVENAVKYGLHTSPPPLRIVVRAGVRDGVLGVEVKNTGRLANGARLDGPVLGTGTGLHNIGERLRQRYSGRHSFDLGEADGWVTARLEIPASERAPARGSATSSEAQPSEAERRAGASERIR
jgi:LytS/YehU family sensor histidine kinase